ncbi:lysine-2,3-aminomutase-like protein [Martelella radicis]|uniref:Lysine 2,3-aminomutase n=1 Tax=Martelella radicis TaxID=1397476 RepID=A0A7W6PBM2_9HYPH|nr:lysine-2,3-aminomutase-like protein [Martelella radicis]MBB4122799.1 lysine 2,3-aminomutase [Martelella radicis]
MTKNGAKAVVNAAGLVDRALVRPEDQAALDAVGENFRIRIPAHVLEELRRSGPEDPLRAQYVPDARELDHHDDESEDPIGDQVFERVKGITHRYPDRLLLKPTHSCQVYCRFCFRREMVGKPEATLDSAELEAALDYIRSHEAIFEVILSGGDPLVLSDRRLGALMKALGAIGHVGVIRFHTRAPMVAPERITDGLVAALKGAGKTVNIVVHVNHARELTEDVRSGLARLVDAGIPLFSQTVLLKGVNDETETLAALFRTLLANRVKPYYLHHLDHAKGVSHFAVPIARGQEIMRALRGRLSGLCLPTYVLDIPGGHGKVPIGPVYLEDLEAGDYQIEDYQGAHHRYSDWR